MKTRLLLAVLLVCLFAAGAAQSASILTPTNTTFKVYYLGQYFDDLIPTQFSARVLNNGIPVYNAPTWFQGQEVCTGQTYKAGWGFMPLAQTGIRPASLNNYGPLLRTNAYGMASTPETWPPGVFEVRAFATAPGPVFLNSAPIAVYDSAPAALTIISPFWCGVFAGGKLSLNTLINSSGYEVPALQRDAFVGLIYQSPDCCVDISNSEGATGEFQVAKGPRSEFFLVDGKYAIRVKSCDFTATVIANTPEAAPASFAEFRAKGYCWVSSQMYSGYAQFDLTLTPKALGQKFQLNVYDIPPNLVYKAAGTIQAGDTQFRLDLCDESD